MNQKFSFFGSISTISWQYNKNRDISDSLLRIVWLVKISKEFDRIWGKYGQKPTQKQPKIDLSAATNTFEIWKLGNYKSDINEI